MYTLVVNAYVGSGALATVSAQYSIPSGSQTQNINQILPGNSMPWEAICELTNAFNCDLHISFPMLASDSYVFAKASAMLATLTPGRKLYIELDDEPFTFFWLMGVMQDCSSLIFGPTASGANGSWTWYLYRQNQIFTIVKSIFSAAGRGSEVLSFINGGPYLGQMLSIAQAQTPPWRIDAAGLAPYISADGGTSSTSFCNAATLNQVADLFIHQIMYLPGVITYSNGVPGSELAPAIAALASFNAATGFNAKLHGYEAGYDTACSKNSYGVPTPYGYSCFFYNWRVASDVRYLPVWRIYYKDYFAQCQLGGYQAVCIATIYNYEYAQDCWSIYTWMNQIPGKGDGSDGKFDNRTCMQTLLLTGPTFFTAGYVGPGAGTLSIVNGSNTCMFSVSQSFTPGKTWIMIQGDSTIQQYYLVAGSGTGPWTLWAGTNPGPNYGGATNASASWVYGNATSQDFNNVSVNGQAIAEWNASSILQTTGSVAILCGL